MTGATDGEDGETQGPAFGRVLGGRWSLEDAIAPVPLRQGSMRSIGEIVRPMVKTMVVNAALKGVIPYGVAGRIVGSKKMRGV